MRQEIIIPTDENHWKELRSKDVTSTESAALFGCSPYLTKFELWWRKKNSLIVGIEENVRMKWGNRLQDAIANGVAEDNGWQIRPMKEYISIPELRMGASFDYAIEGGVESETKEGEAYLQRGILEVKNVDSLVFKDGWIVSGDEVEAPPHIEIQVQQQLAVSGREFAYIAALIGGNKVVLVRRDPQPKIIEAIKSKVAEFWDSIEANREPAPDFNLDSEFITKLCSYASPGKVLDITGDETALKNAQRYRGLGEEIKARESERDAIKAEFLRRIQDSEKVIGGLFTISAGIVGPAHVEYDRAGYRSFKISWRKQK